MCWYIYVVACLILISGTFVKVEGEKQKLELEVELSFYVFAGSYSNLYLETFLYVSPISPMLMPFQILRSSSYCNYLSNKSNFIYLVLKNDCLSHLDSHS